MAIKREGPIRDARWQWIEAFTRALDDDPHLVAFVEATAADLRALGRPLAPFLDHVIDKVSERAA